ncbi:winged helix family two component transcriptional regulator [Candidatus Sulfuricurvum sp. RIFRC-1]|uniref:response regulator transcription factor n=1 Tax=Candidatus Sulfuricurvum sp. RIFRC-1 TaxID=1249480 RepID=UPI000299613E|nr:response regulator transcription factor [Candidatus Sulfuricurvum sp. RIFRC-1]AFV96333.1 winged helix family two component transcriptional regulator [Candidatus Sulfuricurvum sp. RIFRC-1]
METLILIVEDEQDILELMEYHLGKEGYETIGFLNTKHVVNVLEEEKVDLILMDRNLPGAEGSEFVESLRKRGIQTPVIFVSAKHKDEEIEQGFERGGDDYITKPFSMKELILRVKAILRRTKKLSAEGNLTYRDISLNLAARTVAINATPVELTKLEFDLLHALIVNENVVLERDYLLEHVWGGDEVYQDRTVNVAINRLKEKIDPDKTKEYIKTVRGVGYTLC